MDIPNFFRYLYFIYYSSHSNFERNLSHLSMNFRFINFLSFIQNFWILIAFGPIILLLIVNIKFERKDILSAIFFGSFILTIIQVIVTFIAMFGWIFI